MKKLYTFILATAISLSSLSLWSCSDSSESEEGEDTSGAYYDVEVDDISYYEKDYAKQFGAKWDSEKRCWYCYNTEEGYEKLAKKYHRIYI